MKKLVLLALCIGMVYCQLWSQSRTITGKVVDENGNPLAGVTVSAVGSNVKAATNISGIYSITIPQSTRELQFDYLGFATYTTPVTSTGTIINVSLTPTTKEIEGVVVTGITRTRKSEYAGAASKISSKDIENRPVGSFDQAIQGRIPGVTALTSSGQPGNNTTIIIRGQNSAIGGTDPLYIVDGIPVEVGVFQSFNANDFESIDVLRDASAAALYGSRGSAGVIVVTTKRGKSGKMTVSYNGQYGVKQRPQFNWDMMTTPELLKAQEDYGRIVGVPQSQSAIIPGWHYSKNNPAYASLDAATKSTYDRIYDSLSGINTNWRDVWFREGSFSNHQITLSGGTGRTRIYSSLALYNEEGITHRTDMKRVTLRNNLDYADDKFTFNVSSNLGYVKRNFQQTDNQFNLGNPFLISNLAAPYLKAFNADGTIAMPTVTEYSNNPSYFTPLAAFELPFLDKRYNDQVKVTIGVTAAYKITNQITAGLTTGIDFRETQTSNFGNRLAIVRLTSGTPTGQAGFQAESLTRFYTANVRPSIGYRNIFSDKHDIDVTLYGEYIGEHYKTFNLQGFGIDPRTPNTPAAITNGDPDLIPIVGGGKSRSSIVSGLGVGRYTYDGKYTLSLSFRRDGSSKLPEVNRWTNFYSIGAIWDAAKESFIGSRDVNTLRLKISYGSSGNSNNFPVLASDLRGDYPYQPTYVASGTYSGLPLQVATYPGNDDLKWETTYTTNIGVDFGFFRNRVYGDVNVYDKRTKDLFAVLKLSATSGFDALAVNAGELQNKGVEVSLNYDVIRNRNLTVSAFTNFSYNRNKVLDLGSVTEFEQGTELITVGLPLGTHYEKKFAGVDAASGAPMYYTADGKVTSDFNSAPALQEFGTWEAPWKGGFGARIQYGIFELSTLFSWQKGATKYNNLEYFVENPRDLGTGNNQANTLRFWQKPGDIVNTPSPLYTTQFSSKFIHKNDFLRWRDLTLSVSLPKSIADKARFISNAKFYIQGTNLLIWTKWQGTDPEAGFVNISVAEFPNPRGITAGLDITF